MGTPECDYAHLSPPRRQPWIAAGGTSMIPKKLVPDLIRDGNRFSGKIMLKQ
jgi:hypothetical protein